MRKAAAITKLKAHANVLRRMGATSLHLFGSTAANTAKRGSDIFIEYDPDGDFSLIELIGIKQYLEDELGTTVDVVTRDGLHHLLRDRIEQSAVRVF